MNAQQDGNSRNPRVAIIGLHGRFPGADNPDALWSMLKNGREGLSRFDDPNLLEAGISQDLLRDPAYVRAAGALAEPEAFDAAFFGISPAEAEAMDPQQRVFLECVYNGLEDAGLAISAIDRPVGVYAGVGFSSYLLENAKELLRRADGNLFEALIGTDKDFLCSRVSYLLNLTGPSVTVQTACSSSLVAVHMASQALLSGECDLAVAGGVSIAFPHDAGYLYREGGILSPDGHCRPFDAGASGTVGGSGAGVVVLKRMEDALADGDRIRAVLRATAINNDGHHKIGFTAPLSSGQAEVIADCLSLAELQGTDIDYVECHGTGTPLGDPIEVEALNMAFGVKRAEHRCLIGSLKGNIGHLDTASGVAGLIKVVLSLEQSLLPASLYYHAPNPSIPFEKGPFVVNDRARPWPRDLNRPRMAGVSAFGIGGTNAHVIVEEAPELLASTSSSRLAQVLPISARSPSALDALSHRLATKLESVPGAIDLSDIAFSLAVGRDPHLHRRVIVAETPAQAALSLRSNSAHTTVSKERPAAFLFPGQGSQVARLGFDLYQNETAFREAIDACCATLGDTGFDLKSVLFELDANTLRQTRYAQPAIFAFSFALAAQFESWGIVPSAMIGHSLGEFVAACRAGVFSIGDAMRLVMERGALMQNAPAGAMLAVAASEIELASFVDAGLDIAAINGPRQCVLSGATDAIEAAARRLSFLDVPTHRLTTSHAFHSVLMAPISDQFRKLCEATRMRAPHSPFLSNVSGDWITAEDATDPEYWTRHLRSPVRFHAGLLRLKTRFPDAVFIEVGPGRVLSGLAQQAGLTSLAIQGEGSDLVAAHAVGEIWQAGVKVDWRAYYAHEQRRSASIPVYPFERTRYSISPRVSVGLAEKAFPVLSESERPPERPTLELAANGDAALDLPGLEREIGVVWSDVLGTTELGPDSRFMEIGGNSLMAIKLVRRLNMTFGTNLTVRELLGAGDIRSQAKVVHKAKARTEQDAAGRMPG